LNGQFSKEAVQMANIYKKKCLTTLAIKESQIQTTMRFSLTPVRMAIKKTNKCHEDEGRKECHTLLVEM
jgi:hypothetical protein